MTTRRTVVTARGPCYGPAVSARRRARPLLLPLTLAIAGCLPQLPGAGVDSASPAASPSASPIAAPTRTAQASPSPTPEPSPTPDPFAIELDAFGCEGGVVLDWSPSLDPRFHHYIALRSPERRIRPAYPPIAPAVDWGDTYATDRFVTSAVDASIVPSDTEWHYRVMAYDERGRVVGASPVRSGRLREPVSLDPLTVEAGPDDTTRIGWTSYRGQGSCFSEYRLTFGIGDAPSTVLTVISDQDTTSIETAALHAGAAYQLRVQAVRTTLQGSFVLGESDPVTYTVP
jgi:hypothetical protein